MARDEMVYEAVRLLQELFPICRSITGEGIRRSLRILSQLTDFQFHEIASGTKVYDWIVPDEWTFGRSTLSYNDGQIICDTNNSNLHLVNYSIPFEGELDFAAVEKHLHTLPNRPSDIPYRTTYYKKDWGFCLAQKDFDAIDKGKKFYVSIKTSLQPGKLTYGECLLPGTSNKEFLVSTYCCHPSLANDNLSGPISWALLLKKMKSKKLKHSYRFVILPETIGAITYLAKNEEKMRHI